MRVHLPGLPHTETTADWETCAFTSTLITIAGMWTSCGHEVILYGGERNDAHVAEHVAVVTDQDRRRWFGDETWRTRVFDRWDVQDPCWTESNAAVIAAIRKRIEPHDLVALPMGYAHRQIGDAFPHHVRLEPCCGYEAISGVAHVAFESYAWMHHTYGRNGIHDGRFYDAVVPRAYDPADFTPTDQPGGYLLYLGRMIERKGLAVVAELAKRHPVVTAGQGDLRVPGATHVGVVTGREKRDLLAGARAVLVPTAYVEPGGGVAVEAQFSGTPVLATDWGAMTETIKPGVSGFRCRTLAEFLTAAEQVDRLDRGEVRWWAESRYSTKVVAPQHDAWLRRLGTLYGDGWYEEQQRREPLTYADVMRPVA